MEKRKNVGVFVEEVGVSIVTLLGKDTVAPLWVTQAVSGGCRSNAPRIGASDIQQWLGVGDK